MSANLIFSRLQRPLFCTAVALAFLPLIAHADIVSNLQARYACNGDTQDTSGNARHLSAVFGAAVFSPDARSGLSCSFDGATKLRSAFGAFASSLPVTYAFWVNDAASGPAQTILMQTATFMNQNNTQNSIDLCRSPGCSPTLVRFFGDNAVSPFTYRGTIAAPLLDNTWHHIAITANQFRDSIQIYRDGTFVSPVNNGINANADLATTFYLGSRSDLLSSSPSNYQGKLDDVRIYSRVLSGADITELTGPPGMSAIGTVNILEDSSANNLPFTVNDLQTSTPFLSVTGSSSNTGLLPNGNIALGGTNGNRTVTLTPSPNAVGASTVSLVVTDGNSLTDTQSFVLNVAPVNDAPTFTPGANPSGLEDAGPQSITNWATAIDDGDPETVQTLNFVVTPFSSVGLTFSVLPSISPSGTLSYTTAPNSNGSATFSVRLDDNGGTANGGVNQSTSQTFNISAGPVNDAPTFTAGANQSVLEDAGPQSIANWATAINTNDLGVFQAVNFVVTPISGTVNFSVFPTISPTGTLSYTSAPNSVGSATFSVQLFDDGGTANGGVNQSSVQNFTISVGPVNDAPTFTAGANQSVLEDAGPQSISNWATALDDGDPETVQALNFVVTPISGTVNFSVFPTISPTGTLSYTSAPNSNGSATFSVQLFDNGGTANGGVNQSAVQNFTISVGPVNDAPTISALSNLSTNEDTATAAIAIIVGDTESAPSTLTLSATSSNLSLLPVGNVVFGGTGANRTAVITPAPDQSGTAIITVTVSDGTDTASQSFSLSVTPVNDPPSFTAGVNQSLLFANNSPQNISNWATAITDGDPDFVQTLSFNVSNSNNALFSVQPSIAANGTLSFTATGAPGTAIVSVSLTDDATAGGPALSTPSITFSITVAANTLPSLSAISAQSTNEDTAAAIAFTVSDIETPASALVVTALSSNTTLIPLANIVLSGTGSNRSLSITPAANRSGTSTITLNLSDGTGSSSRNFVLTVNPINDLPSFIKGTNQVIAPGITGAQSISNWASAIDDGDADFTQALSFNLSSDNPSLFTSQPSVSAAGTLSFTPAGIAGIATVSISLTDDASAGGGALTTAVQSFTITIQAVPIVSVEQRTPTSTVVGQPFTVRVRVRNPTGSLVPTGTVSVTPLPVGTTVQCSLTTIATPPGSAEALCTNVISPIASAKLVLAVYDGNPVFLAAEASDTHAVDKAATQLRILEDLPDPSPSNTPVAVRYQLEVLAPSVAPLSSLNGIITLSDGINQTSAPFSLSNPVISLVMQGDGSRVLTLRYSSDSNFLDSTATEAHTLTGGNSTDLAVTVSNGKRYVQSGGEAIYLIRVRNLGGINSSAQLNAFVPEGLSNYRYTCTASADSSCHALNGTGAIIAAINVAAGGEVTYTVRADVTATEPASITHSARIVPAATPPDTNASNDVASDTDFVALYLDGFED